MKNRNIVKQDYHLVNAKYKLNTSEIKFIMTVLAQVDKDDVDFKEYEIKISELEAKLQSEQNETRLKQFAKKILSKPLEVPTNDGWVIFNWFEHIEYLRGHSKFKVSISKKLKPYLLELKERFVKYNLKYILPLTSNYSIRLYQLLKEYETLTRRTFTVSELQDLLQVPPSLKIYNRFKEKVLVIAEKELIENCDIFFEFEEIKDGRKINEILFRIKPNSKNIEKNQPTLFNIPDNPYARFFGRTMSTKQGTKTVLNIVRTMSGFEVYYLDGTFSLVTSEPLLLSIFGEK
jgi:plasmid replication initiation protein